MWTAVPLCGLQSLSLWSAVPHREGLQSTERDPQRGTAVHREGLQSRERHCSPQREGLPSTESVVAGYALEHTKNLMKYIHL